VGANNIPKSGNAVIASNHMSHLDGIIINSITAFHTRRKINFLAAEDVYNKNFLFRFLCNLANCIPVKRATSDRVALLKVIKLLKKGNLVGLFPEGQRSRDGKIGEAKLGVAIMALKSGAPIIPLAISGTFEAFPRKTKFIRPVKVTMKFGAPLKYDIEKKPSKERINFVKDEIMDNIQELYSDIN
jgi:1-acyl-sn-glycerol-3-phosphate acyltransferase